MPWLGLCHNYIDTSKKTQDYKYKDGSSGDFQRSGPTTAPPTVTHDGGQNVGLRRYGRVYRNKLFQFEVQVSRKIILSLSERLSKVSESILFAFFLRLDYIRSNRPACVAVKEKILCFAFAYR